MTGDAALTDAGLAVSRLSSPAVDQTI